MTTFVITPLKFWSFLKLPISNTSKLPRLCRNGWEPRYIWVVELLSRTIHYCPLLYCLNLMIHKDFLSLRLLKNSSTIFSPIFKFVFISKFRAIEQKLSKQPIRVHSYYHIIQIIIQIISFFNSTNQRHRLINWRANQTYTKLSKNAEHHWKY